MKPMCKLSKVHLSQISYSGLYEQDTDDYYYYYY